jgi:hypothetical protein
MFAVLTEIPPVFTVPNVCSFMSPLAYRTISEPPVFDALIVRSDVVLDDWIVDTLRMDIPSSLYYGHTTA